MTSFHRIFEKRQPLFQTPYKNMVYSFIAAFLSQLKHLVQENFERVLKLLKQLVFFL